MEGDQFENLPAQMDEVEALSAIFGDDWVVECPVTRRYAVRIKYMNGESIKLLIRMPEEYPSSAPPHYQLEALQLTGEQRSQIHKRLNDIYAENVGQSIIYLWIESINDYLQDPSVSEQVEENVEESYSGLQNNDFSVSEAVNLNMVVQDCPTIYHGEPVTDRKSKFQAHVASVTGVHQVELVLSQLLENKKIADATHNIFAYRIQLPNGAMAEDCEDDGETQAGSRVLHLLQIVGAINVIVIVTRWYGGIHLGPDRFKHINNCARDILEEHRFIQAKVSTKHGGRK